MTVLAFLLLVLLQRQTPLLLLALLALAVRSPAHGALALPTLAALSGGGVRTPLLGTAALAGALATLSADTLLGTYLGVELQSYALYVYTALAGGLSASRTAGVLYFLAGSLASVGLLAGWTLDHLASPLPPGLGPALFTLGLLLKIGSFPLGGWALLVYPRLLPETGALVMTLPKASLAAALGTALALGASGGLPLALGTLSVLAGSLLGLAGERFMAVLALSGVAHAGYTLAALATSGAGDGTFYALQYAGCTAALLLLLARGLEGGVLPLRPELRTLAGWGLAPSGAALALFALLLALGGIPPAVGFYAKAAVLWGALAANALAPLPLLALSAALGRAFYLWLLVRVAFGPHAPLAAGVGASAPLSALPLSRALVALALPALLGWEWVARLPLLQLHP